MMIETKQIYAIVRLISKQKLILTFDKNSRILQVVQIVIESLTKL